MKKRIIQITVFLLLLVTADRLTSAFFLKGLEHYYGLDQEADILIVGHSHLMKTCNKEKIEEALKLKVSKYCREGVMIRERYRMVQHFLASQQDHSVPIVLYGVDPLMFHETYLSKNSYRLFYPFMNSHSMDELVRDESTKWYDYPLHKYIHCSRYTDVIMYRSLRGWLNYWDSMEDGIISDREWQKERPNLCIISDELLQTFHDTIQLLVKNNCHVVLVYPGIIQSYRNSAPEAYDSIINRFQKMAEEHPNIDFLNYSTTFSHRQEMFEDSVHINRQGEKLFNSLLIKDLEEIISAHQIPVSRE